MPAGATLTRGNAIATDASNQYSPLGSELSRPIRAALMRKGR
jgi:hypothetical protein